MLAWRGSAFLVKPIAARDVRLLVDDLLSRRAAASPRALLPGSFTARSEPDGPAIRFRTLNGYQLWPVRRPPDDRLMEALRMFQVRAPDGSIRVCAAHVTRAVQGQVRELTAQDYPPEHPIWDSLCRSSLSNYLWEHAEFPPETLLVISLTWRQVQTITAMAGLRHHSR